LRSTAIPTHAHFSSSSVYRLQHRNAYGTFGANLLQAKFSIYI